MSFLFHTFSSLPKRYWISLGIALSGVRPFEISFATTLFTFKVWTSVKITIPRSF